jgi:hypothetical protein
MQRGYLVLDKLVSEHGLSESGAKSIIQAFDPFHDLPISDPQGWPDVESGASVVRLYKQSVTVAAPPGLPAGSNWDCHVVAWPWMIASNTVVTATRTGNNIQYPALPQAGAIPSGGVSVYGLAPGTALNLQPGNLQTQALGQLSLPPSVTAGSGRLVGYGFEVHNTTAEIYKQGSVAVYRQQAYAPTEQTFLTVGTGTANEGTQDFTMVRFPPATNADALLLNGTQQWEAKDGCYVPSAFMSAENPALPISNATVMITAAEVDDQEGLVANTALNVVQPVVTAGPFNTFIAPSLRVHPIHQSGAIFTGLSNNTTLTINANIYYEAFPYTYDKDILVLAKPSCQYDPKALLYYSELMQSAPVGVPVRMNGLGDWFALGLSKLAGAIGEPLSKLPGLPGIIGQGAKWAAKTLPMFIEEAPKKAKPQKQQQQLVLEARPAAQPVPGNSWMGVPAARRRTVQAQAPQIRLPKTAWPQTAPRQRKRRPARR